LLGLPPGDHQAVEADVVDVNAVGQVSARIRAAEGNAVVESRGPLDPDNGGNRLAWSDGQLERSSRATIGPPLAAVNPTSGPLPGPSAFRRA
jgi:hypothetical protein